MSKNLYCHLPWTHIFALNDHNVPCCIFETGQHQIKLSEYNQHPVILQTRQDILDGKIPDACRRCKIDEERFNHSYRLLHNNFESHLEDGITTTDSLEVYHEVSLMTSNTCNLKCTSCKESSYVRHRELDAMGLLTNKKDIPIHFARNPSIDSLSSIKFKKLVLLGGEPFFDKVTFNLLEELANSGRSQSIELDINTNMTGITQEKLDFLVDNFSNVQIKASIDGIGKVNDYLRYGSDWETIDANVKLCKEYSRNHFNIQLLLVAATSNLSMLRFYQVMEYVEQQDIVDVFLTTVHDPALMDSTCIPRGLIDDLRKKYSKLKPVSDRNQFVVQSCLNILDNADDSNFANSLAWYKKHDQHRGTSVFDIFPELLEYDR